MEFGSVCSWVGLERGTGRKHIDLDPVAKPETSSRSLFALAHSHGEVAGVRIRDPATGDKF